jgi:hypothetical protein
LKKIDDKNPSELELFLYGAALDRVAKDFDYICRALMFIDAKWDEDDEFREAAHEYIEHLEREVLNHPAALSTEFQALIKNLPTILNIEPRLMPSRDSSLY